MFLEKVIRFGAKYQENINSSQTSLFGEETKNYYQDLTIPSCESWSNLIPFKERKRSSWDLYFFSSIR